MKIKFFATLFVLAMGSVSVFAQKGVEDGSKYGHGQDSINCLNNLSVYYEYVKTGNFRDAYLPWKAVIEECPKAQLRTYTSGVQIMKWKLQNIVRLKKNNSEKHTAGVERLRNFLFPGKSR